MNPPRCPHCGLPVDGAAVNSTLGLVYHGECYLAQTRERHGELAAKGIALYSHDERIRDGLEWP